MDRYEALYLHIPFCRAKCSYCDFDSRTVGDACALGAAIDEYLDKLYALIDAHARAGELEHIETVYIGGGTPSVLGERLPELVRRVRTHCSPVEFTCEVNPESFASELAKGMRDSGVTRISMGVQSLQPPELKAIGRIHSAKQALKAIQIAKNAGFSTSCDVMCGLPLQTEASWRDTLTRIIAADPHHISVYPLQLEEGTPLAQSEEAGEVDVPSEDFQAACMDIAAELLEAAGYARYEVASYAKPGYRCRHNIAYWTGKPYLGLGRSAASMREAGQDADMPKGHVPHDTPTIGGTPAVRLRFTQLDDAGEEFDRELLTVREAVAEDLMLACRMTDGLSCELLDLATTVIPEARLREACDNAVGKGLVFWDNGALKPTHKGWLEGNELFGLFWGLAT